MRRRAYAVFQGTKVGERGDDIKQRVTTLISGDKPVIIFGRWISHPV